MIIVEGPDGSGKSTLVKALSEELNLSTAPIYATSRRKMAEQGVRRRVFEGFSALLQGRMFIHDRFYYSELVYGSILRKSLEFSIAEMGWIEVTIMGFQIPVIICLPPRDIVAENIEPIFSKSPDHIQGAWDNRKEIYDLYYRYAVRPPFYPYDYTSEHQAVEYLLEWLRPKLDQLERTFSGVPSTR